MRKGDHEPYGHWTITRGRLADQHWSLGINRIHGYPIGVYANVGRYWVGVCRPISGELRRRRQERSLGRGWLARYRQARGR
jgi:hypothetical protein